MAIVIIGRVRSGEAWWVPFPFLARIDMACEAFLFHCHLLIRREDRVALELLVLATQPGDSIDVVHILAIEGLQVIPLMLYTYWQ